MKTLTLGDLEGKTKKELVAHLKDSWRATDEQLAGMEILIAYESVGSWGCDSSGFFLLRKGRKLFEVHGSHCSCYGFEDQFNPEPTTRTYLRSDKFGMSTGGYDDNGPANLAAVKEFFETKL